MAGPLTIVMYHHVRPIAQSRHPRIRGLEREQFAGQLDYLEKHYRPVTVEDVIAHLNGEETLPQRAVLLQFDDGYRDHYLHVLPELDRRGIQGTFFPITCSALDRKVINAHKVQFILAHAKDIEGLIAETEAEIVEHGRDLPILTSYRAQHFHATRIDTAPVIYVKRMLQVGLPLEQRERIADILFRRHVSSDVRGFADELYMPVDEIKALIGAGHHVGCHSENHPWMTSLDRNAQRAEVISALRLHDAVGLDRRNFTFCYPYGGYNEDSIAVLDELGCAAAFTAEVALADLAQARRLALPRLDTIDLPMNGSASPNAWTQQAVRVPAH
jgi:peptidoglycan/xylan/chitin deacetylase (PgdA/CDA1 family)